MNYQIYTGGKVQKFIDGLDKIRRARVDRIYDLFEMYGTYMPGKYIKKLGPNLWELRPGDIRLFLTIKGIQGFVVHGIMKKTQKTPRKDLSLAMQRIKKDV